MLATPLLYRFCLGGGGGGILTKKNTGAQKKPPGAPPPPPPTLSPSPLIYTIISTQLGIISLEIDHMFS
jgi:hypothetical protein